MVYAVPLSTSSIDRGFLFVKPLAARHGELTHEDRVPALNDGWRCVDIEVVVAAEVVRGVFVCACSKQPAKTATRRIDADTPKNFSIIR